MDTIRALNILGFVNITNISCIDRQDLKSKYRKLIRKNHPDLFHDSEIDRKRAEEKTKEINKAYEVISSMLDELDKIKKWEEATKRVIIRSIIPFSELEELYSGKSITLKDSSGEQIELTKSGLKLHNIMLLIECDIKDSTGNNKHITAIKPYVFNDNYEIDAVLTFDDNTYKMPEITLSAYGKEINLKLRDEITRVKLAYKYRVFLTVQIEKKRYKEEKQNTKE